MRTFVLFRIHPQPKYTMLLTFCVVFKMALESNTRDPFICLWLTSPIELFPTPLACVAIDWFARACSVQLQLQCNLFGYTDCALYRPSLNCRINSVSLTRYGHSSLSSLSLSLLADIENDIISFGCWFLSNLSIFIVDFDLITICQLVRYDKKNTKKLVLYEINEKLIVRIFNISAAFDLLFHVVELSRKKTNKLDVKTARCAIVNSFQANVIWENVLKVIVSCSVCCANAPWLFVAPNRLNKR